MSRLKRNPEEYDIQAYLKQQIRNKLRQA